MLLNVVQQLTGRDDPLVVTPVLCGELLGKQIEVGLADQRLERLPQFAAVLRIGKDELPVRVLLKNIQWQAFDERMIERFGMPQRLFGRLPRGDVPEHPQDTDTLATGVVDRRFEHLDVEHLAVRRAMLLDVLQCLTGCHHLLIVTSVLRTKLRGEQIEIGFADQILQCKAEHLAVATIGKNKAAVAVLAEDIQRQVLDQGIVHSTRLPQRFFGLFQTGHIRRQVIDAGRLPAHNPDAVTQPAHLAVGRHDTVFVLRLTLLADGVDPG